MIDLTAHILVRDEEVYVRETISSILPIVKKIIIIDTGSIDSTIDIIKSFNSPKIHFTQETISDKSELTKIRNKMIDLTKTEWFIICDADELIDNQKLKKNLEGLTIPSMVNRITVPRVDFYWNHNLIGPKIQVGKIFRTKKVRFTGDYPVEILANIDGAPLQSLDISGDVIYYHFSNLRRSYSRSPNKIWGNFKHIRAFPIHLFFGPVPSDTIKLLRRPSLNLIIMFFAINLLGFHYRVTSFIRRRIFKKNN